ncbi:MAG: chromosomal replication initiator protein DnaA, partial [Butyricicoccus sp.]|nr:chromosomal replication initiator protein DnaA [Butyricicoccus sp.]
MNSINDLFQMVLTQLEGSFPKTTINAWFSDAEALRLDGNNFVLAAANQFKKELIESRFTTALEDALTELLGEQITLIVLDGENMKEDEPEEAAPQAGSPDSEYTFQNFIVGSSNKLAHAAAMAVATKPATDYNPLFIYGQSGLGKTHLLHAIGNVIHHDHPDYRIIYIKGEEFTNQLINAISDGQMEHFRNKYRQADLLLIDDIQFIAGKERTQEEFFHTFNALYESGRQIVLTSDRPPKEMNTLEDRMKTRFEWGLLVEIQPPDYETRIAIINAKAKKLNITIPKEVIYCIAENLQS